MREVGGFDAYQSMTVAVGSWRAGLGRQTGHVVKSRWSDALAGVAAAAVALGVAELVGVLVSPRATPLVAVGGVVIDVVPESAKELAIRLFGTYDKVALLIGTGDPARRIRGADRAGRRTRRVVRLRGHRRLRCGRGGRGPDPDRSDAALGAAVGPRGRRGRLTLWLLLRPAPIRPVDDRAGDRAQPDPAERHLAARNLYGPDVGAS